MHLPFRGDVDDVSGFRQQVEDTVSGQGIGRLAGFKQLCGQIGDDGGVMPLDRDGRERQVQVPGQTVFPIGGELAISGPDRDVVDPGKIGERLGGMRIKCSKGRFRRPRWRGANPAGNRRNLGPICGPKARR
ncbi:MAG: hypothetical protein J5I90_09675 [Caldilineales bacterium]|nr:hypothetical protein [Caldilineales bacterium]